jgi:hypothetical protein
MLIVVEKWRGVVFGNGTRLSLWHLTTRFVYFVQVWVQLGAGDAELKQVEQFLLQVPLQNMIRRTKFLN